jgi:hypothetical protein
MAVLAGGAAGLAEVLIMYPLDLVGASLKTKKERGIFFGLRLRLRLSLSMRMKMGNCKIIGLTFWYRLKLE